MCRTGSFGLARLSPSSHLPVHALNTEFGAPPPHPAPPLRAAVDSSRALEALATRRDAQSARRSDLERRIRELGSLPQDAFEPAYRDRSVKVGGCGCGCAGSTCVTVSGLPVCQYVTAAASPCLLLDRLAIPSRPRPALPQSFPRCANPQELMKSLEEVGAALEKFAGVNRKALDQYLDFDGQKRELVARLKEQVGSRGRVRRCWRGLGSMCGWECGRRGGGGGLSNREKG